MKLDGKSFDIVHENIQKLKELFPEIVTGDDEIDFEGLRELFINADESFSDEQYYNLNWWGKNSAKREIKKSSSKTLRPLLNESKDWDSTGNIYIEGDNLDVLKILLGSYRNRIKMIYIDPPYNTGNNELIYDDKFSKTNKKLLRDSEQVNDEGFLYENPNLKDKTHSSWLTKMYPRLYLSRKLLTNDGIICISIDEHEMVNLKFLCNEIYGENNLVGEIIRKTKTMTGDNGNGFNLQHEYLLIYAKNKSLVKLKGEEKDFNNYSNSDNDINGDWCLADPSARSGGDTTYFPIENPYTGKIDYPPNGRYWAFSKETLKKYIKSGKLKFKKEHNENERGFIFKRYKKDVKDKYNPVNSLFIDNEFLNEKGTSDLKELFENNCFDYPKPVYFIKKLIQYSTDNDDIILDFFSGSATTAQATLTLNSEFENKNNKFIMVQIPQKTDENSDAFKCGFKNICEIGMERIKRAGNKILEESDNKDLDIGFKVFKVDESNFIPWNSDLNQDNLEQAIISTGNELVEGRSELDFIYELLLKRNMDLNCPVDEENVNGHKVYVVDNGYLLVCLESNINETISSDLINLKEELFIEKCEVILRDAALNDTSSINIYEKLKINNIEFNTI